MAATREDYVALRGSARPALPGERRAPDADPDERIRVTVLLRHATPLEAPQFGRRPLRREEFAARHGAREDDIQQVRQFAAASGLTVVSAEQVRRTVVLEGTAATMAAAFDTTFARVELHGQTFRALNGAVRVPASLQPILDGVFGLDTRPVAHPRTVAAHPDDVVASFAVPDLVRLYGFPLGFTGLGQTIAIIELGGGFQDADLDSYFSTLGLATPLVEAVSVDGGANSPTGDWQGPDGEVMLDIEVAGSIAPGASLLVYFAPDTDQSFLNAVITAVLGPSRPTCVSISWGGPEELNSPSFLTSMNGVLNDAAALGITVCVAAGDSGSSGGADNGAQNADFPASSPFALACGGTILDSDDGTRIDSEVVWNDDTGATGGGVSDVFPLPSWQFDTAVPPTVNPGGFAGRGFPDVAANASPHTGYLVRIDGDDHVLGGTSAVAPLWAGLIALMNQYLGLDGVGFLNQLLYGDASAQQTFNDIVSGNNGSYSAGPSWDPCTGWGTPNGDRLLQVLGTWSFAQIQTTLI
jgi:kumamolisin